jgi:glycosyltransferase involved in cell wall biosynthesis
MRFSVVIPLYNKAPYVGKAIQSVLAQTFTDYELIIVDDGSKDDSAFVAAQAIGDCSNCHLIKQENAGVSIARNNGVAFSQGEYLCFLDADDWWESSFLQEMDGLIKEFPEAGIYGTSYTIVNETKHKTRVAPVGIDVGFEKGYINYCHVYSKTLIMPLTSISVAIPRLIFEESGGFPRGIKLGEDFLLWIRIALKYKVAFLNKSLAYYNQDVEADNRSVGRLHKPEEHMLWNLKDLTSFEQVNPDFKQLIDNLRTYGLYPYYLSKDYHDAAVKELKKVDWEKQPKHIQKQYHRPLPLERFRNAMMKGASHLKSKLLCLLFK